MMSADRLSSSQKTILGYLINGSYLETDGIVFWLVMNGNYSQIDGKVIGGLISRKMLYSKMIDDETTLYYISDKARELMETSGSVAKLPGENAEKEKIKAKNEHTVNKINKFLNLK